MPIILNDNMTIQAVDAKGRKTALKDNYSPKFFKSLLTGKGGTSRGLLNETKDPKNNRAGYKSAINPDMSKGVYYNKDIKIHNIPFFLITPSMWDLITNFNRPDMSELTKIASGNNQDVYITAPVHAAQIEEISTVNNKTGQVTTSKEFSVCFHVFLFAVKDINTDNHVAVTDPRLLKNKDNAFCQMITQNLCQSLSDIENQLAVAGYTPDHQAFTDFLQNYSLFSEICNAAKRWQEDASYYIADVLIKNVNDFTNGQLDYNWTNSSHSVADVVSRLEKYSVPLNQYQEMYEKMKNTVSKPILDAICKSNLNLRLSNTLNHMNENRAALQYCPCNVHASSLANTIVPYSDEQIQAIESASPLTLVQSGAGTGKSTVIKGRIHHMIANGIDPDDITVLSFTNAAADHIKAIMPAIHSMTIASMLHAIYSNNYPTHQLSSLSTIINSIDIYFTNSTTNISPAMQSFVSDFKYILKRLRDENEYTRANNFVEDHIDETIDVLDIIQQTSLELESIICYQKMDTLVEPPETRTKHLIIDEVQDNSIAEFIYSIKYTDKHCCSLYIVGDCSQTLYEFRASNPKALNVLESSGVFETHKLQTNYRSNQEILDFANVLLGTIEANQYANIVLKANSLKPVTYESFKKAVNMAYTRLPNKSNNTMEDMIKNSIFDTTANYIGKIMAKPKVHAAYVDSNNEPVDLWTPDEASAIVNVSHNVSNDLNPFPQPITNAPAAYPVTTGGLTLSKNDVINGEEFNVFINIPAIPKVVNRLGIMVEFDSKAFEVLSWISGIPGAIDTVKDDYFATTLDNGMTVDLTNGLTLVARVKTKIKAKDGKYSFNLITGSNQVAILAPYKHILYTVEKYIKAYYPKASLVSLVPKKPYDNTVFSNFIAYYWGTIKFTPPDHLMETIEKEMLAKIAHITSVRANQSAAYTDTANRLAKFRAKYDSTIKYWESQAIAGIISQQQLLDETKQLLISFEIKNNAAAQAVRSAQNAEAKKSEDVDNANFVLSTIHSAKGLEFDNVLIYYSYRSDGESEEEYKRKYYVALTRAKDSEFIYSYDDLVHTKIQNEYERLLTELAKKTNAPVNDDCDDDDDVILPASQRPMTLPASVTGKMEIDPDASDTIGED